MQTSVGQLVINELLPEDLRNYTRVLDKQGIKQLLHDVYVQYPEKYREIAQKLSDIGREVSYRQGSSISLKDLEASESRNALIKDVKRKVQAVLLSSHSPQKKNELIREILNASAEGLRQKVYDELIARGNRLAVQVLSGARGNKAQLASITNALLAVPDSYGITLPIPVYHSFAEGLTPAEHWATTYGSRQGVVDVKLATADAGYLGKTLNLAAHRLVVTEPDCGTENGILVDTADKDNLGAVLARQYGPYKAGTVLTPQKLKEIRKTDSTILVRSPITCQAEKGLCQKCAGVRERGTFPPMGDIVGITAASSIGERLSQGSLSAKHGATGGSRTSISGFDYINSLVQVPKHFRGGAAHAELDGRVSKIEKAPQGGQYVYIGNSSHHISPDQTVLVRVGEEVEAGDVLSDGIPNPAKIVKYKGIGEGRRYFVDLFKKAFEEAGHYANRRNVELISRALINHVRSTDMDLADNVLPDDILEYDTIARKYEPRYGAENVPLSSAKNKYLERPVLHYSIGTRVTDRVAKTLKDAGYTQVLVNPDPPPFIPEMHRALDSLGLTSDWLIQQGGFYTKRRLLQSAQRGSSSDLGGISYIPKLVSGEM